MADDPTQRKVMIVDTLKNKSVLKQKVFDNTCERLSCMVKEILKNLAREVNVNLGGRRFQDTHGIYRQKHF
ncbi:MAG: hypothetical protein MZV63_61925 [Marinilabiliales bacterium]|nr:hypothetical protein [Marinilabiliales bacterium]